MTFNRLWRLLAYVLMSIAAGSFAPAAGPVQMVVLSKVQLLDAGNNVLARYDELPLVPNNLIGFRVTEGPL